MARGPPGLGERLVARVRSPALLQGGVVTGRGPPPLPPAPPGAATDEGVEPPEGPREARTHDRQVDEEYREAEEREHHGGNLAGR